ncbi:MAG: gamma-glutamyl-gamma-aminobutyrate hydrolase family protein [Myxococcota bacterium]
MPHVAVIDPGLRVPELDCFNRMSRRSRLPLTYHLPALFGLDSLRDAGDGAELAGIVVLGSGASVNDRVAWLDALCDWLGPRLRGGVPVLGLCFGHQLIARIGGGTVGPAFADGRKAKGLRAVSLAPDRLWGEARAGTLLVTHGEAIHTLPTGFAIVGSSEALAVEVIAHHTLPVWGFQAHPEATPAFAVNNAVPFDGPPAVLSFGHGLVDAFLDHVADGAGSAGRGLG